ncbi:hypothetical protein BU16DRAFT_618349 [Lophium mytilinum]|uniref:Uncharacterized protein n=1 Tax=Lophium mytilinum TaxID=390894 RepID=A0A6A6QTY3_9PEZI|nr:hypothetical protein BU16DRAFT_618349 [Lophium mytilinum]
MKRKRDPWLRLMLMIRNPMKISTISMDHTHEHNFSPETLRISLPVFHYSALSALFKGPHRRTMIFSIVVPYIIPYTIPIAFPIVFPIVLPILFPIITSLGPLGLLVRTDGDYDHLDANIVNNDNNDNDVAVYSDFEEDSDFEDLWIF